MEVNFVTKVEINRKPKEEFLKLSGGKGFMAILRLSRLMNHLPAKVNKKFPAEIFVIDLSNENLGKKD